MNPPVTGPMPDIEWLAVEHRVKPALRVTLPPSRVDDYVKRIRASGMSHVAADRVAALPGRSEQAVLYVAHDLDTADRVRDAESTILPGLPSRPPDASVLDAHRRLGAALGYPSCCVEAFLRRLVRGVTRRQNGASAHEDFVMAEDAVSQTTTFHGRLNNLLFDRQVRLISFYPCRFDCPEGLSRANGVHTMLKRVAPTAATRLERELACVVRIGTDGGRTIGDEGPLTNPIRLDFQAF